MNALAKSEIFIPEERAIAMIEACAEQIAKAATIPDIQRVITQAEAIGAVMRKLKASETIKDTAFRLVIDAERQLGVITKQIPHAPRGGTSASRAKQAATPTKQGTLKSHGLNAFRCSVAEKLALVPEPELTRAMQSATQRSVYGVTTKLGLRKGLESCEGGREKISRDLAFLANEAIGLLEACLVKQRPPHTGTVRELRDRLGRLTHKS